MATAAHRLDAPHVPSLPDPDALRSPAVVRELTRTYMIWDAHVGGERRVDVPPLVLPAALDLAARRVAEGVTRAVGRVAGRALLDAGERRLYGLHPDVERLASASHEARDGASLVRVDLLLCEDGRLEACEINADCPGGHNEALGLPRLSRMAGYSAGQNPTCVVEALVARLEELSDGGAVALLFATAYAEDLQVCALLERHLTLRGVRAVLAPATAPRLAGGELMVGATTVRALYRYFPAEYMQGQANVEAIARSVARGRVRTLTSFSHIYAQSKLSFARAWRAEPELPDEDREVIAHHLPPTFDAAEIAPADLLAGREAWVLKRAYGRVGDEVFVGPLMQPDAWSELVATVARRRSAGESWVAQRFVRQRTVQTPWGARYVTLGVYVLDGAFVGYFVRLTPESHVSHGALCVPVFCSSATEV